MDVDLPKARQAAAKLAEKHGGKRKGAGRKQVYSGDTVRLTVELSPQEAATFDRWRRAQGHRDRAAAVRAIIAKLKR